MTRKAKTKKRRTNKIDRRQALMADSGYLLGDAEAGHYLRMKDKQGRTFATWADKVRLPYNDKITSGEVRSYRKKDIDWAWEKGAKNLFGFRGTNN